MPFFSIMIKPHHICLVTALANPPGSEIQITKAVVRDEIVWHKGNTESYQKGNHVGREYFNEVSVFFFLI